MTSRFVSNMVVLLLGAFLTVAALNFVSGVLCWLTLATGCLVVSTLLVAFACSGRGLGQRVLDACMVTVGAWVVIASRSFGGTSLKWLSFSAGALMVFLAVAALIVHEVLVEIAVARGRSADRARRTGLDDRQPAPFDVVR